MVMHLFCYSRVHNKRKQRDNKDSFSHLYMLETKISCFSFEVQVFLKRLVHFSSESTDQGRFAERNRRPYPGVVSAFENHIHHRTGESLRRRQRRSGEVGAGRVGNRIRPNSEPETTQDRAFDVEQCGKCFGHQISGIFLLQLTIALILVT